MAAPAERKTFQELGLSRGTIETIAGMGITRPTDIQIKTIPPILRGENVAGKANTGSGKTASFALPIIESWARDPYGIFALVLTPSRELAMQIAMQFRVFCPQLNTCVVIGGVPMLEQCVELEKRPHVVVATPGRFADHVKSARTGSLALKYVQFLVLDEADRLFEDCFRPAMESIVEALPPTTERQTLLFSATMTKEMLTDDVLSLVNIKANSLTMCETFDQDFRMVEQLDQQYLFIPQQTKECYLLHLLQTREPEDCSVIVFTSTTRGTEVLTELLTQLEVPCVCLSSAKSQQRRTAALGKFRSGRAPILIATDLASRGLDIPTVHLVVNYDVPRFTTDYVHRVGRTARAGRGGKAVTLVSQYDIELFKEIEKLVGREMEQYPCKEVEVLEKINIVNAAKRMTLIRLEDYERKEQDMNRHSGKHKKKKKRKEREQEQGDEGKTQEAIAGKGQAEQHKKNKSE